MLPRVSQQEGRGPLHATKLLADSRQPEEADWLAARWRAYLGQNSQDIFHHECRQKLVLFLDLRVVQLLTLHSLPHSFPLLYAPPLPFSLLSPSFLHTPTLPFTTLPSPPLPHTELQCGEPIIYELMQLPKVHIFHILAAQGAVSHSLEERW